MVCVSFCVICIAERLVSSVICRFQGLSYSHVPECIEFSFILFIHHNIHFYFELCTYCNILDIYLSWNMNSVKCLFIWNYWIIYFVTCVSICGHADMCWYVPTCGDMCQHVTLITTPLMAIIYTLCRCWHVSAPVDMPTCADMCQHVASLSAPLIPIIWTLSA